MMRLVLAIGSLVMVVVALIVLLQTPADQVEADSAPQAEQPQAAVTPATPTTPSGSTQASSAADQPAAAPTATGTTAREATAPPATHAGYPRPAIISAGDALTDQRVAATRAALTTGEHPERVTLYADPTPFDAEAYAADPTAYLSVVEPGRVFFTGDPARIATRIRAEGKSAFKLRAGESVVLAVRVDPRSPVTFTTFNGGLFAASRQSSVTVAAGDDGVASVRFHTWENLQGEITIKAGSPLAVGVVSFLVRIID